MAVAAQHAMRSPLGGKHNQMNAEIGKRIKAQRIANGLTQGPLAKKLGVTAGGCSSMGGRASRSQCKTRLRA
jgi:hypothetical protein